MNSDQRFFDFLKERIGLDVTSVGPAIIERAVRQRGIAAQTSSADEYWRTLQGSRDEQQALIEAVIVPETWFFRYPESFATLAKLASKRLAEINNLRALRILSLPCSTGEEPYSIAMAMLHRFPPTAGWQIEIVASDLSNRVLNAARAGLWSIEKAGDIPLHYRKEFMLRGTGSQAGKMKVGPELRDVVSFTRLNLNEPVYPVTGLFDFIFCRNVLIYFDRESKAKVVDRLMNHLTPGGCLFLGYAETTTTLTDRLVSVGPNVYARVPDASGPQAVAI